MPLTKAQFDTILKKLKRDGQLTASGILKMAENESSPLHSIFEWDDTKAAREYRLYQARLGLVRHDRQGKARLGWYDSAGEANK